MRARQASQTASLVALLRALADAGMTSVPGFRDPSARQLLAPPWSSLFRFAAWRLPNLSSEKRKGAAVAGDVVALRTVAIDAYLFEALERGVRQVVILGAGLDGRAYRLQQLAEVEIFEVDHPATQSFKQTRLSALTPKAKRLHFVPVDFEKDSLEVALERAGHRASEPTFFIWEGVVMYLTDAAVRSTLRVISARAAPGSSIVINYATPRSHPRALDVFLRLWGEPMIGQRTPSATQALVQEVGFDVVEDQGMPEWAQRFGAQPPPASIADRSRALLAVARCSQVQNSLTGETRVAQR